MDILEKILTGNLGYGVIIILAAVFFAVYQIFIVPKLQRVDGLENNLRNLREKHKEEVDSLRAEHKEKVDELDQLIADGISTISSQQETIAGLEKHGSDQASTIEKLTRIDTMVQTSLAIKQALEKLEDELEGLSKELKTNSLETENAYKGLIKSVNEELSPVIRQQFKDFGDKSKEVESRLGSVESLCREMITLKSTGTSQLSSSLAVIESGISDLRGLYASQRNLQTGDDEMNVFGVK